MGDKTSFTANKTAIVVGGGYTGLAAAYDLCRAGYDTTIYEADSDIGGLAGTFEPTPGSGYRIEKFYHHWFNSDSAILGLIKELGLESQIKYFPSNNGIYSTNTIFRLQTPLDLLRFSPLPVWDRIRTGLMALRAKRVKDWRSLEGVSAEEWIIKNAGRKSYEAIWKPLLVGKFGEEAKNLSAVWFWCKIALRGGSRDKTGTEQLAYFSGTFGAATDAIRGALEERGVAIHTNCPVTKINIEGGVVKGVETPNGTKHADVVLATVPLPVFLGITPDLPKSYSVPASQVRFLGNVCTVFRLRKSLSSTYWLNVADPSFPFVGIIEHTNFDDPQNYNGEHIAYLSKYLPTSDPMYSMPSEELLEYSLPYVKKIFPKFSKDWVIGYHVWRERYSQPVITRNYSKILPAEETPVENLWLSTMAQIYPEDRGTNYAVKHGRSVAKKIIERESSRVVISQGSRLESNA